MADITGVSNLTSASTGAASLAGIQDAVDNLNTDKLEAAQTVTLTNKTINGASNTVTVLAGTQLSGQVPIANGGTGASTASAAFDALKQAATTTATGVAELATAAETTTGTDAARVVTPDGLSGSDFGKRIIQLKVNDDATALTTGDGKLHFFIPPELNGYNLVDADAGVSTVSSSGTPTVQVYNVTQTADMLSTRITIDENEKTSYTAAAQPVIDASNDDVATGDELRVDVDVAGTGAKGLVIILTFQLP